MGELAGTMAPLCFEFFFIKLALFCIVWFCFILFGPSQRENSVLKFILPLPNLIPGSVLLSAN
jgi:hypothetical protein